MYSHWICDTQSGAKLFKLAGNESPSAGSWATRLNGIETGRHTFQLRASGLSRASWRDLMDPWRRTIETCWNDRIVYSGLILGRNYDLNTGALTIASGEIRTILARRMLFGIGTYATGTKILTGRSLRGLIYQIMFYATQGALSLGWDLPFHFPAFDEAGDQNREYWNYLFDNAESLIAEAQDTEGGPDVHLNPVWRSDGRREYEIRLGTPRLSGPTLELHPTADAPDAFNLKEATDASEMVTGVFALGNGSEQDMKHGEAATVALPGGYPSLDVTRQFKSIDDVVDLAAHARAEVAAFNKPTKQLTFDVLAYNHLDTITPGSPVNLYFNGDAWLDDGWSNQYCIGYRGDLSQRLTIDTQKVA